MKIVLVHKYARPLSGADVYCLDVTRLLREAGHEVYWLSTADAGNVERIGAFVPPTFTRERGATRSPAGVAASALWNRRAASAMGRLVEQVRPDVVYAHKLYPQLSAAPVVAAASRGVPVVQMGHDYEFVSRNDRVPGEGARASGGPGRRLLASGLFHVRRRLHVPLVSRFVVASEFVARAHRQAGLDATVLPLFVEDGTPPLARRRRSGVVFVGRLLAEKGAEHVVALAGLLPDGVPVTAVGDGPLEPRLRAAGVRCTGRLDRSEARALVARARVAVFPSLLPEAAGLAALEAMAAGTPVVAYASGGLGEYVAAAGGVVVPPNPERLLNAVTSLYGDAERRAAVAASQAAHVAERHSPARHLDGLLELFAAAAQAPSFADPSPLASAAPL